jgi:cell division protease FtsH
MLYLFLFIFFNLSSSYLISGYLTSGYLLKKKVFTLKCDSMDYKIDLQNNNTEIKSIRKNYPKQLKYGYPKQANRNITYPTDEEIEKELEKEEEEVERVFKQILGKDYSRRFIDDIEKNNDKNGIDENFDPKKVGMRIFIKRPNNGLDNELFNGAQSTPSGSENFEIVKNISVSFKDVGGYDTVKSELNQSVHMLTNLNEYEKYKVRTPKGMILEGPPGNGKTLIAKAFSGEVNASFIPVSGSQFQEKYVGVGASRIRELFDLAVKNKPCIIFIDEIDAVGRSRGTDESSGGERDSTLNQLLVAMDGFKSTDGVFVIGATNRVDLLDKALIRPGRIDKTIHIGNPDLKTRKSIIDIHIDGKPCEDSVDPSNLLEITNGMSGAQIENLLNEAMLYSLRDGRDKISTNDIEVILSRILVGYQPSENTFSSDMIKRIAIHEMGHAIVGIFSLHHAKLAKVCLNLWSPTSPGYTIFENAEVDSNIYTKEKLQSRLMVLLSGRIAEQVFFGASITSGASKDIEEAYSLAEQMIVKFGMGQRMVNAYYSDNSKMFIDKEIERLVDSAYQKAHAIIIKTRPILEECSELLIDNKILLPEDIYKIVHKYNIDI